MDKNLHSIDLANSSFTSEVTLLCVFHNIPKLEFFFNSTLHEIAPQN